MRICDGSVRLSFFLSSFTISTLYGGYHRVHIKMDCTVICIINDDGKDRILTSLHYVKDPRTCVYVHTNREQKCDKDRNREIAICKQQKKKNEHSGHASHSTANISILCRRRNVYLHACMSTLFAHKFSIR